MANVNVRIIKPQITEEERQRRMEEIKKAAVNLYVNTQRKKEEAAPEKVI